MKRKILLFILLFQIGVTKASDFYLVENGKCNGILYTGKKPVVEAAVDMLIEDSKLVAATSLKKTDTMADKTIVVGVLGEEPGFMGLLSNYQIDTSDLINRWEAFKIQAVSSENRSYLFIIGSDPRGAAYGVLELSRQLGVSPWVWWADVVPAKKMNVKFFSDHKVHAPSVQYRGIFLNDEDWALMPWSSSNFEPTARRGAIGPKTYAKIFELLLRLRANMICPAMHECTVPFYQVERNKEVAEKYGIIVSTSHAEPMMCTNTGEWKTEKYGAFNYFTNKRNILSYWDRRANELTNSENIYTLGLRGIHDGRMQGVSSIDEETKTLEDVVKEQRKILQKHHPRKKLHDIPQIFVPYKEVLKAYNNGLSLPEDVTLVWCDDNHGYIMRLSDADEQKRSGGSGIYYHISYWGKPHDYLWLASTQPALIYTEMKRAWNHGAKRYWVLNAGDIKPGEYLTEFFLDMAWDIHSISNESIYKHQQRWIESVFNKKCTEPIHYILKKYYHLAGMRKPEHMGWNKVEEWKDKTLLTTDYARYHGLLPISETEFSPFYLGDEIQKRINAYNEIGQLSDDIYENRMPSELRDAYFQLVHYPVKASGAMNRKLLYLQKARLYVRYHLPVAVEYKRMAMEAYNEIAALDYTYNKDVQNGKWQGMMDMKPRDLPVFQEPELPEFNIKEEEGVLFWVENRTTPTAMKNIVLPIFTNGEKYHITIHSRKRKKLYCNIIDNPCRMQIRDVSSDLLYEKRLEISLRGTEPRRQTFSLDINGTVYTFRAEVKGDATCKKHVEGNRMVALNASEYARSVSTEIIEGLGYSGSAVKLPSTQKITSSSPYLEYDIITHSVGQARIKIGTIFRHPANPASDLRYAVAIDNQPMQIISVKSDFLSEQWAKSVLRNQCLSELTCNMSTSGKHTIKIYALDEELIFDQIMVDFDLDRKCYAMPL